MSQALLSPNLTKEVQWEVSQIADKRFPCVIVYGGSGVNLNHLKIKIFQMSCLMSQLVYWLDWGEDTDTSLEQITSYTHFVYTRMGI